MSQEILSLKSIYKILTANDYPVYSGKVISKEHHKGLSLVQFWQDMIIPEWKETPTGTKIWRFEGGRNRYTSEVCNRSEHYHFYGEYIGEIASSFSSETLFQQIVRFVRMLKERNYNYKFLVYRIKEALKCYERGDMAFDKDSSKYFKGILAEEAFFENLGSFGKIFFCSYLLTMLMLHGLAGNGEGKSALLEIYHKFGCEIKMVYYDACTKEVIYKNWNILGKQDVDLHRKEMEWKTREYLNCLIACYEQLQDVERVQILKNTLAQMFDSR